MNHQLVYNNLIEKATKRLSLSGYVEHHHIIPRSVGGSDHLSNLVTLTAREHFIAHLLLAKIYGGPLIYAAYAMCYQYNRYQERSHRINSYTYEHLKKKAAKLLSYQASKRFSGIPKTPEHKEKIRKALKGRSNSHLGKKKKPEHVEKIVTNRKNNGKEWHSQETKNKISESAKSITPITCPYCGKTGSPSNMKRWHFNNCRQRVHM